MMFRQLIDCRLGMVGLVCGGLMLGLPTIALTKPAKSVTQTPSNPEQLLTPDQDLPLPKAQLQLVNGKVTIKLINKTNAIINYQAVGDTEPRTLAGGAVVTLQALKTPVTLTVNRQDRGLLEIIPKAMSRRANLLEATLDTTTNFSVDKTTVRIEQTGSVYLY